MRIGSLLCIVVTLFMGASGSRTASAESSDVQAVLRARVEREIFVVFDPLQKPPSAQRIALNAPEDRVAAELVDLLGPVESVAVWYPQRIVADDILLDEIERSPRSPLAVLNEVLLVRFREGTDSKYELERLRKDPRVLGLEPNSLVQFSVDYGSPVGAPATRVEGKYQWGMQLLRFPGALAKLRGSTYVSILDTGIQNPSGIPHAELARALRPRFSSSRMQASSGHLFTSDDIDEGSQHPDYRGHGTHVAGIIAAQADGQGVSGGCPDCALMVQAVETTADVAAAAILDAVVRGAQVINMSFGIPRPDTVYVPDSYCAGSPTTPPCNVISIASQREVVLVASSGNDRFHVQFPANQPGVMAIGGLEFVSQLPTATFWTTPQSSILPDYPGPSALPDCLVNGNPSSSSEGGSNCGPTQFLVAPARNVLSTFYAGEEWSPLARCMDMADGANRSFVGPLQAYPAEPEYQNGYVVSGYGTCTGTSMSAPHVTAAAALVRSANPLLLAPDIRRILQRHASGNDARIDDRMAYGFPYVDNAVIAGLSGASLSNPTAFDSTVKNRLTPLFSLYSGTARNHIYTIAPQMAVAAINGTLLPSPAYKLNQTFANVSCSPPCNYVPVAPVIPFQILNPNSTPAVGVPLYLAQDPAIGNGTVTPASLVATSNSTGIVPTGMIWTYVTADVNPRSAKIDATVQASYPIAYSRVGNIIAGYPYFPSITTFGSNPKSTLSVYVSHVNPLTSGPDMVPLYRMSARCGDVASTTCDNVGGTGYNPFHVSHRYATSDTVVSPDVV